MQSNNQCFAPTEPLMALRINKFEKPPTTIELKGWQCCYWQWKVAAKFEQATLVLERHRSTTAKSAVYIHCKDHAHTAPICSPASTRRMRGDVFGCSYGTAKQENLWTKDYLIRYPFKVMLDGSLVTAKSPGIVTSEVLCAIFMDYQKVKLALRSGLIEEKYGSGQLK